MSAISRTSGLRSVCFVALLIVCLPATAQEAAAKAPGKVFRAGASTSNITPPLGENIIGGWEPFPAKNIHDELHARCLGWMTGRTKSPS